MLDTHMHYPSAHHHTVYYNVLVLAVIRGYHFMTICYSKIVDSVECKLNSIINFVISPSEPWNHMSSVEQIMCKPLPQAVTNTNKTFS
jgi:hypothetical protein